MCDQAKTSQMFDNFHMIKWLMCVVSGYDGVEYVSLEIKNRESYYDFVRGSSLEVDISSMKLHK